MQRRAVLLSLFLILSAAALVPAAKSSAAAWKPVTPRDLALTAAEIGDVDADAAILFREGDLNDSYPDGTSLRVYVRIKIFTERGRRWADVQLPYRVELGRITDVHARTVRRDGTPIEVDDRDVFDNVIMKTGHGIWRAKAFSMPAVEPGAIIEYRYRQVYPDGFRYFALDLQSDLFTKELFYRIKPPAASKFDMRWVAFNARESKRFTPQWDGAYFIKASDIGAFRREPMMPPDRSVKIWGWLYYTDEFQVPPERYWRDYATRVYVRTQAETKPTQAIRRIVDTITLPGEALANKIQRIYDYTQHEIKNLGYREPTDSESESDPPARQNASAEDTLRRRYGTAAEVNRLFIAMLRACGVDARVAELTTRDEAVFHRHFPDAVQFNSELAAVISRDGTISFYDPGTAYCPAGILAWEKEAVPALIHGRGGEDPFAETPVSDAVRNVRERRYSANIRMDGSIAGNVELTFSGQRAIEIRNELSDLTTDERATRIRFRERQASPTIDVPEASITVTDDNDARSAFKLKYDLTLPDVAVRTEKRLLVTPTMLAASDFGAFGSAKRNNALFLRYGWTDSDTIELTVPPGYSVEQLPTPIELDAGALRYRVTFAFAGDKLFCQRTLSVRAIYLAPEQYAAAKTFFDRVKQADATAVTLIQRQ